VIAAFYVYGHLMMAAFSLAMAMAFAVSAARLPDHRRDAWSAGACALTAAVSLVEMGLALRPSLALARSYVALAGLLLLFVCIVFHAQYAADVFDEAERRRQHRLTFIYALTAAVVCVLVGAGLFDHGARPLAVAGVSSMAIAASPLAAVILYAGVVGNLVLLGPLLLRAGERREERRVAALSMFVLPIVGAYELGIAVGVVHFLPIAGYVSGLAGLSGIFVLIERLRALSGTSAFGPYVLGRRLGGGDSADVFEARRAIGRGGERVVRRVALKRLRSEHAGDRAYADMFLDEARLLARLSHPNIVTILDAGSAHGELYLAMELVDGAPLSRLIQRCAPCDVEVAVEVGVQLTDALAYAHDLTDEGGRRLEIVHRDLSPRNILVTRAGHLKLTDFGIARFNDRLAVSTSGGLVKGTFGYMAPEQIRGAGVDQRSDLYAVGVVLFELLTGVRPYAGDSDAKVLLSMLAGEMQNLGRLDAAPPALAALIKRALAPDPRRRPATAAAMRDELLAWRNEARARDQLRALVSELVPLSQ
jgi:tRNA A-37 threonylcarbamoyl transferase component Bud32